jgi:protoheme IX farnesyltransferase
MLPPHLFGRLPIWALASPQRRLCGVAPHAPRVAGEATRRQIVYYSFTLLPLSLSLYFIKAFGLFYLISSTVLGVIFILGALQVYRKKENKTNWQFFAYSIVYLLLLFGSMMVDTLLRSS